MSQEYMDHVRRYLPALRSYGLDRAANHLECWLDGNLDPAPPLDISAPLDFNLLHCLCVHRAT